MRDLNQVNLMGRLGAGPVLRQTKTGSSVANFSLATSRRFPRRIVEGGQEPEFVEETEWHKIVVWGKQAELCCQYLKKGDPVYLAGSIRSHSYVDQSGSARTAYEVHADEVHFLGTSRRSTGGLEENHEPRSVAALEEEEVRELSVS